MKLELTKDEQQQLLTALDIACKQAPSSLAAASVLLPLAAKIQALKEEESADKPDA